jgi:uncharacterized protein YneR
VTPTKLLFGITRLATLWLGLATLSTSAADLKAAKVDPKIYDAYVGQYQIEPGFLIWFWRDKDRLMSQATGQGKVEVFPKSETEFFVKEVDARITFVKGPDGKVTHLVLHQNGDHEAKKISNQPPKERVAVKVDPKIYTAYVGDYELQPGAVLTISKEENRLMAQLTGQQKFELFPESETKFFYEVVDAQISFKKDAQGKVTGLVLHQRGEREARKIR